MDASCLGASCVGASCVGASCLETNGQGTNCKKPLEVPMVRGAVVMVAVVRGPLVGASSTTFLRLHLN